MTTTAGGHRPGDPAAAARDGVEAPVRPVLVGGRGLRNRAGLIAVAAVAITVVAAGVGLGGRGIEPPPGVSGSAAPSGPASSPRPSAPTKAPASAPSTPACLPVDPSALPEIRLWSTAGDGEPVLGVAGPPDWALASPPTSAWPVPDEADALVLAESSTIVLLSGGSACVGTAIAEFLAVDDLGGVPEALTFGQLDIDPPRARVVLGSPPLGDWILRVVAHYSTGGRGRDGVVIERFFRVVSAALPSMTPYISPAVACGARTSGAPLPRLSIAVGGGEPVVGVDLAAYPGDLLHNGALASGSFPDAVEIRVEGDVCATSWSIEVLDPLTGDQMFSLGEFNPTENPAWISQNRMPLSQVPLGESVIRATVAFGRTRLAEAAWELRIEGPPVPAADVVGTGGARAAALPGCEVSWTLAGASAYRSCRTMGVPEILGLMTVRPGEVVRLEVPGWDLDAWSVMCGERSPGAPDELTPLADCMLGSWGDGSGPVGPVRFMPFPGRWVVAIWVYASRGTDSMSVHYFVEIEATT